MDNNSFKLRKVSLVPAVAVGMALVLFQNCSDVSFKSADEGVGANNICLTDPAACVTPDPGPGPGPGPTLIPTLVTSSFTVPASTNKADILFVIDNSGSMRPQLTELGNKFPTFISSLANLDWQVCVTTTDITREDGRLLAFADGSHYINSSNPQAALLFTSLMASVAAGGGDERGLYAINRALARNEGCFRPGASLSTVVISDEDERSTGGYDQYKDINQFRVLEDLDYPSSVLQNIAAAFGVGQKIYSHHSIVIRPGDTTCFNDQATESPAFYGTRYAELTASTQGILGDICAADYGSQLSFIGQNINNALAAVPLDCNPVDSQGKDITNGSALIKSMVPAQNTTATLQGNKLSFSPALPSGTMLSLSYYCLR